MRREQFPFPWRPGKSLANLFATKWVHVKHYGLEIGGPNFWRNPASFLISTNQDFTKSGSRFPGTCFSEKKTAGRLKLRQRGLANRIRFFQNPQIPESQIPNLQMSESPRSPNPKSGNHLDEVQKSRDVSFLKKTAAGRLKPRQRGLANRICFYQNPQIPESQIPNLKISQIPKMQIWKFAILDEKSIGNSRWSFF